MLEEYDAGYLPDNPDQDYVRYILACAYDFYKLQYQQLEDTNYELQFQINLMMEDEDV